MKRFKEFLIMFITFLVLSILSVLWFVFNTSSGDFFNGSYLLKLMVSPYLIIALFNTFVLAGVPSLLLTGVFAFLMREKKKSISRRKYYTYLFLLSLVAPVVIILVLTRRFDVVNNTIYSLQIGLLVVFIHWVIEWTFEKCKNNTKKCPVCQKSFNRRMLLKKNAEKSSHVLLEEHLTDGKGVIRCPHCAARLRKKISICFIPALIPFIISSILYSINRQNAVFVILSAVIFMVFYVNLPYIPYDK